MPDDAFAFSTLPKSIDGWRDVQYYRRVKMADECLSSHRPGDVHIGVKGRRVSDGEQYGYPAWTTEAEESIAWETIINQLRSMTHA